ncbi:MAG: HdeD family acid-resistance protein [Fimbriimonadaceae bacterium]
MKGSRMLSLIFGLLLVLCGISMISIPYVATAAVALSLGVVLVVAGLLGLIAGLTSRAPGWGFAVGLGLTGIALGGFVLARPERSLEIITALFALQLLIVGIFRFSLGLQLAKSGYRTWTLLNGVISVILGVMIMMEFPESAYWVIGLFVGIDLLMYGIGLVLFTPPEE